MAKGKPWNEKQKKKIILSLKPYFEHGYSVNKACILAGIPTSTIDQWIQADEALRLEIGTWRNKVNYELREVVVNSAKAGNTTDAKWWLEGQESKVWKQKDSELEGENAKYLINIEKQLVVIANRDGTYTEPKGDSEHSPGTVQGRAGEADIIDTHAVSDIRDHLQKALQGPDEELQTD